jgi:predicted DNA-binding helix-hairpin-helix protein
VREHRLYQADWLLRFYRFRVDELTTPAEPNLDLSMDPKLAWALRNRASFPIDLNRAGRGQLLRVPGLGVRTVERILSIRRFHRIRLEDLVKLRVPFKRVRPFVIVDGHNPDAMLIDGANLRERVAPVHRQLSLFDTKTVATFGEF